MVYEETKIRNGINIHQIDTEKFKTNIIAIFLSTNLTRENVTKNAVLTSVLRRGSKNLKTQEEISKKLDDMYGAEFDCGLDKIGENHVLKFYVESINDEFIPEKGSNILAESIEILTEIIFNPLIENGGFKKEYIDQEKENVKQIIESKKDNKAKYAAFRCIEEMYKDEPAGLYKFGYVEDLKNIDANNLYKYYCDLINKCKIDIFISGNLKDVTVESVIENNEKIKQLKEREAAYAINRIKEKQGVDKERYVEEALEVAQGKIVMGYDIETNSDFVNNESLKYIGMVYNGILGGSANSKLFQNVREKESLAYTTSSSYSYYYNCLFINAGIDIPNFEKTVKIIKKQVEDMKNGDFSDDDILNIKKVIVSSINFIDDEQDTEIMYFLGQALSEKRVSLEQYAKNIMAVTRKQIEEFAQNVKINLIYFLKNTL